MKNISKEINLTEFWTAMEENDLLWCGDYFNKDYEGYSFQIYFWEEKKLYFSLIGNTHDGKYNDDYRGFEDCNGGIYYSSKKKDLINFSGYIADMTNRKFNEDNVFELEEK